MRQDENYEEVKVKTTLEENLAIHTLLTLWISITPTNSEDPHRLSTHTTPLHISRPGVEILSCLDVISYGDVILDEVIELPKFDLNIITIEKMRIL